MSLHTMESDRITELEVEKKLIRSIFICYPRGVTVKEFCKKYLDIIGKTVPFVYFGYLNVEDFLRSLCDVVKIRWCPNFRVNMYYATDIESILHIKKLISKQKQKKKKKTKNGPLKWSKLEAIPEVPRDIILPGINFKCQNISVKKRLYIPVYTSTIINPSLLWVQLIGDSTSKALEELMNTMHQLYESSEGMAYVLQSKDIVLGGIFAGIYTEDNYWHRISITDVPRGKSFVNVYFVDYGTHSTIEIKNLRYLKKEFVDLPAQAIKSRLSFIKPSNGDEWKSEVGDRLLQICSDKPLMVEFVETNLYPGFVSLWLCDISTVKDDFISLKLVQEGYAKFHRDDLDEIHIKSEDKISHSKLQEIYAQLKE